MYPHERSLVKRLADEPFALLGINSDSDRQELKKVLAKEKITWRSWWDGGSTAAWRRLPDRNSSPSRDIGEQSVGPQSDNRGYACVVLPEGVKPVGLQWVHGPITVVMVPNKVAQLEADLLQWVHGPITVVMMNIYEQVKLAARLQWVHGPITVVMARCSSSWSGRQSCFNGSTVR